MIEVITITDEKLKGVTKKMNQALKEYAPNEWTMQGQVVLTVASPVEYILTATFIMKNPR